MAKANLTDVTKCVTKRVQEHISSLSSSCVSLWRRRCRRQALLAAPPFGPISAPEEQWSPKERRPPARRRARSLFCYRKHSRAQTKVAISFKRPARPSRRTRARSFEWATRANERQRRRRRQWRTKLVSHVNFIALVFGPNAREWKGPPELARSACLVAKPASQPARRRRRRWASISLSRRPKTGRAGAGGQRAGRTGPDWPLCMGAKQLDLPGGRTAASSGARPPQPSSFTPPARPFASPLLYPAAQAGLSRAKLI